MTEPGTDIGTNRTDIDIDKDKPRDQHTYRDRHRDINSRHQHRHGITTSIPTANTVTNQIGQRPKAIDTGQISIGTKRVRLGSARKTSATALLKPV